jgi:DUF1680 family protein
METNYPWEGRADINFIVEGRKTTFKYGFRIPHWCKSYHVELNGQDAPWIEQDGYALISHEWRNGDRITIVFDMPVNIVETNPLVRQNAGKAAVTRGPVVYCLEEADNGKELFTLYLGKPVDFTVKYEGDFLEGVTVISCTGKQQKNWNGDELYHSLEEPVWQNKALRFIPYYAWANRGPGEMIVWVNK